MLSEIERTLIEILRCGQSVPTNTAEVWYKQLRTLGTDNTRLEFSQSQDECWTRVALRYTNAVVGGTPDPNRRWQRYCLTTLDTPAILQTQKVLQDHVIFVAERIAFLRLSDELLPEGRKDVHLTFSRRLLAERHADIKGSLERVLAQITEETELLREDHLARGRLVHTTMVVPRVHDIAGSKQWEIDGGLLESHALAEELPEYWGRINATVDFISNTEDYPWMPVKISEGVVPF